VVYAFSQGAALGVTVSAGYRARRAGVGHLTTVTTSAEGHRHVGVGQKLAIARAFYQAGPVRILDEPTSAIDAEAELEIFENLEAAYRGKTLIEGGRVIEAGAHDGLLGAGGRYASMFRAQAAGGARPSHPTRGVRGSCDIWV
jgi:hypothetical protein